MSKRVTLGSPEMRAKLRERHAKAKFEGYAAPTKPGLIKWRLREQTGVWDAQARGKDPAKGRYLVTCREHRRGEQLGNLQSAEWLARNPGAFCPKCAEAGYAGWELSK